jgi:anti-sigma factor RsiW
LNCREFIDFLFDYFAGDLPPATFALFHEHIGECPDCVAYLDSYEQTVKLVWGACRDFDEAVPAEVPEDLIQAILIVRQSSSRG